MELSDRDLGNRHDYLSHHGGDGDDDGGVIDGGSSDVGNGSGSRGGGRGLVLYWHVMSSNCI